MYSFPEEFSQGRACLSYADLATAGQNFCGKLYIGLVVGEISGDLLAADFIQSLLKKNLQLKITGILGPNIRSLKHSNLELQELYRMEDVAVMGLVEPLKHLPKLLKIRSGLIKYFKENPPRAFLGIDAPDFNLALELKLKNFGIKTVHYVGPSVWAWRKGRIFKIKKAIDGILVLFPFEEEIYKRHDIPVRVIGHPFAEQIPLNNLNLNLTKIALLPGSRWSEIKRMGALYLETAQMLYAQQLDLGLYLNFIMPLVSVEHKLYLEKIYQEKKLNCPIEFTLKKARTALDGVGLALATSGTVTLELMLLKIPMVVAYKMNPLGYWLAKKLVKLPYISLPNLLAQDHLVPEFIQGAASAQNLSQALGDYLNSQNSSKLKDLRQKFQALHQALALGGSDLAAKQFLAWI
ncbi:MAG: lipid-A-disaccharide synthase [Gammaproteobacteria bacterium]